VFDLGAEITVVLETGATPGFGHAMHTPGSRMSTRRRSIWTTTGTRSPRPDYAVRVWTVIVRCVHGLEWVCADEVAARVPSAASIRLARREVVFDLPSVDSGLRDLRTVDDVFVEVGRVEGVGTTRDALGSMARHVADLPYEALVRDPLDLPAAPRVDVVASVEGRRTYSRFHVENAVGPLVASRLRGSYLARTGDGRVPGEADLSVRLFLRGPTAIAAVRLGRRPLHRRPYKQDTGPGTLHPPVAAALARLADPPAGGVLLDPFCGDGTIAIEARLAHRGVRVVGSDIDAARLDHAAANADRAGVRPPLVRADATHPPWRPGSVDALVTNPPWNLAVDAAGSLEDFWVRLPGPLAPDGRVCVIADEGLDAPATLRRLGYPLTLATRIRLAGRVSVMVLAGAPRAAAPALDAGLARWRERAIAADVITDTGF
jgi:23S rRNA G2445 N2-methylase RlmL